jgi:hypothetical protein
VWGFVAYGVLCFFLTCGTATAFLVVAILLVGDHGPLWAAYIAWVAGFLLPWWPFGIWVSRRRRAARRLFREGDMLEAVIVRVDLLTIRGAPFTRATVSFMASGTERRAAMSVGGHSRDIVQGAKTWVLFEPHYRYCAVFTPAGAAVPAAY